MFSILKSKKNNENKSSGIFSSFARGLRKTRDSLSKGLGTLFLGKKVIDKKLLEEIETQLILADVGVEVTQKIIADITEKVSRKELNDPEMLFKVLKQELLSILTNSSAPPFLAKTTSPAVILVVGVNGAGKTTSIGKLAKHFQAQGKKVMLAAGDTFRAAAIEQLQIWGERNDIAVIAQHNGADSASVIFDAYQAARARQYDILIADTAGRLHTQQHLMEELKKIKRVLGKIEEKAPHEVLLILDATTGQNALRQAEQFNQAMGVTGIVVTKLDGTAKGGIVFAIAQKMQLPIYFIGVGEQIDDLLAFQPDDFVTALFEQNEGDRP
jgi:fused signal recognition particle receptor